MLKRSVPVIFCTLLVPALLLGDTLHLKDKALLTGKILAEKKDLVIVDLGFTALSVPRQSIVKITREKEENASQDEGPLTAKPEGLYLVHKTTAEERPVREWAKKIGESVVQVRTPSGLGSGFFLSEDGFFITNFHVVEGETQIAIEVYHQSNQQLNRKTYRQVRIVALHKFADLALLKVEDPNMPKFVPVPLGETRDLSVGEPVFAIGSPLGLERTFTEGILSTKTRLMQGTLYLQTNAQINPGNSGGPLFNLKGEVVGVINMKSSLGEGLGFAIPVDTLKYFLEHRDAFAYDNDNPANPYRYLEPLSKVTPLKASP